MRSDNIVQILMELAGLTKQEATEQFEETREMVMEALENGDCSEAEDIMADELGLEPDYIEDFIL